MGKDPLGPEEEEEEDSGLPGVPQAPQEQAGRRPASPQPKPTQSREASSQDASDDLSKDSSTSRFLPESLFTLDSSDDKVYTDSLTSHTTASDSTIGNLTSSLEPHLSRMEVPKLISKTESQFSSSMPYLEDSIPITPSTNDDTPSAITVSDRPDDSVFASDPSPETSSSVSSPETPVPIPRRSTRSTKGKPPKRYGNISTFDTIVDMGSLSNAYVITVRVDNVLFLCINASVLGIIITKLYFPMFD